MPIEFVTWMNQQTFPFLLALPEVYENEADNGSDHIYLTSPLRYRNKVLALEFLTDLPLNNMVRIKGNGLRFDVQFMLVPIQVEEGGHVYELNEDTWDTIVQELDLEDGMIVFYTKKRAKKILQSFHLPNQVLEQLYPRDHFEEDSDMFYKPYAEIEARKRLAISADFLGIHPMHTCTQRWRLLARVNGFAYQKLIRFWYMYEVENLDAEDEADRRYPVFHLCWSFMHVKDVISVSLIWILCRYGKYFGVSIRTLSR
uniref:Uncharacterized protein n=1 Tax=Tanacetum cinerariifolium TaxID=118510 RepID=A0A699ISI6_TANCI|nr:hypothetical protein [Tanacetum cinerariifolium]